MLLDPFEAQFHLPAPLVKCADDGCRKREIVGEKHQRLARLGILEADTAQIRWIILVTGDTGQHDGLVADDARAALYGRRVDTLKLGVRLGARDKKACAWCIR